MLVLRTLLHGPAHGHQIGNHIQRTTNDFLQMQHGSLYPALHRLETRKLLTAEWRQTASGRDAKFYRLTRSGRVRLEAETANWKRLSETVGLILDMAEGGTQ